MEIQNVQELVTAVGNIQNDIEDIDGEIEDVYALRGGYDYRG